MIGWSELVSNELEKERAANGRQVGGDHYRKMKMQPWEVMGLFMTQEEFRGFLKGNALKYILRAGSKGPEKEDIEKAHHYLEKLLEVM